MNHLEIAECERLLFTYDVVQDGWEQEQNGFTANAGHTLTHLNKDAFRKDFSDPIVAETQLAPDNLMYALRFCRWGHVATKQLVSSPTSVELALGRDHPNHSGGEAFLAHATAVDSISDMLHEEGHQSAREAAYAERINKCLSVGRLLFHSAVSHAEQFDFDLFDSFETRLSALRVRFSIPQPQEVDKR